MLDSLLTSLAAVCRELLPILGAVALVFLCLGLKKLWKVIESVDVLLKKLDPTLDLANQSLEKVQAPLDTVVNLSHSCDDAGEKIKEGLGSLKDTASENVTKLKDAITEKVNPGPVVVPAEEEPKEGE